ncbi:MAG: VWA domain-containing protein [Pirellulaceae bacterium]
MINPLAASSRLLWAQTEQTRHQFTRVQSLSEGWHWLLLVAICALILTFVITMYRRDSVELPVGTSIALMFLRTVAYFGILFFFLNLEKLTEQTLTKNSRALVLIDTSQSMGLRDGQSPENPSNASRLNLVADELAQGTLIKDLRKNHDVVVYRFDEEPKPTEIGTFPKLPSEDLAVNQGGSLSQTRLQSLKDGRRTASAGGLLLAVALLAGIMHLTRRRRPTEGEQNASWPLLVSMVTLIAGVVILAIASLRSPDIPWMTMVGLQSLESTTDKRTVPEAENKTEPTEMEINWADQLTPRGTETHLGDALQFLINKERGGPIAGIVVVTDGGNNAGEDVPTVLKAVRDSHIAIYPVGVGSNKTVRNVRVLDLDAPERVYPGDDFSLTGYLQSFGLRGRQVTVQLVSQPAEGSAPESQQRIEEERRIELPADGLTKPIDFELTPEEVGRREYILRVKPPAEDKNDKDNQKSAIVESIDRRMKILLMAGGPTREYRFLRNQIFRDEDTILHVLLQTAVVGVSQESDEMLFEFPQLPDELFEYDCIVAFDADWQALETSQVELLERFIAEKAGGLIVIAGPIYTPEWSRTRRGRDRRVDIVKNLYPVVFYNQGGATLSLGHFGGAAAWPLQFTDEGTSADFLWLADDQIASEEAWAVFDGVYGFYKAKDPKPGAQVFARFSDPNTSIDNELPIYMAGHFYGAGRVFFQASGEMWRLRALDVTYFEQYYTKLIRWASQGRLLRDSSRGVLLVDKERCLLGDHVGIQAILTDAQHQPLADETVNAILVLPDGTRKPIELRQVKDAARDGMFAGQFTALQDGDYQVELQVPQTAEEILLMQTVRVRIPALEIENPKRDDALLKEVAQLSQGEYYIGLTTATNRGGANRAPLASHLEPQDQQTTLPGTPDPDFEEKLMAWLIALICGALCLEWLIRRLARLA